uniref:Uncharacterized protein n=1 Tax=Eutreptiella gymnastica TaxID=73025 RepID=A0A7S4FQF0_9EUGL
MKGRYRSTKAAAEILVADSTDGDPGHSVRSGRGHGKGRAGTSGGGAADASPAAALWPFGLWMGAFCCGGSGAECTWVRQREEMGAYLEEPLSIGGAPTATGAQRIGLRSRWCRSHSQALAWARSSAVEVPGG